MYIRTRMLRRRRRRRSPTVKIKTTIQMWYYNPVIHLRARARFNARMRMTLKLLSCPIHSIFQFKLNQTPQKAKAYQNPSLFLETSPV